MINLKLAEYNKDGKFQGLLELCKTQLLVNYNFEIEIDEEGFLLGKDCIIKISHGFDCLSDIETFYKDKKDPLKRFGGLFDGLTYGEGRFVLCESIGVKDKNQKDVWAFDIAKLKPFDSKLNYKLISNKKFLFGMGCMDGYVGCDGYGYDFTNVNFSESFDNDNVDLRNEIVGNLFENPELYEKIK
jgi:hypothetical protein